jgi:hypothetical protein
MEVEPVQSMQCEPQTDTTVLALYTTVSRNSSQQRVPHTRSVYLMRETRDDDRPPALVMLQNLEFVLYAAADGELSTEALLHCMQESYCLKQCSRKACAAAAQERLAQVSTLTQSPVFRESEWTRATSDDERRAHCQRHWDALTDEQRLAVEAGFEAHFTALLQSWRHRQALDAARPVRDANAELFGEYRRLADPVQDRDTMDAPHFFVPRAARQLAISARWPCVGRLKDKQVWEFRFDSHAALEHFVHAFRSWPLEFGGQWYPTRVKGREVHMQVLEAVEWGVPDDRLQLRLYEPPKRFGGGGGSGSHEYALAQTPLFEAKSRKQLRWQFEVRSQRVTGGLLQPALWQTGAPRWIDGAEEDRFGALCAVARRNDARVCSSRATLTLSENDAVLLLDFSRRTELKVRRETGPLVVVDYTAALTRQLAPKKAITAEGRKRVDLKRRPDEPVAPIEKSSSAVKKARHEVDGSVKAPLRQASLWDFSTTPAVEEK